MAERPSFSSFSQRRLGKPDLNAPIVFKTLRAEALFRRDTRTLDRDERSRYSSFLWNLARMDMGPKVTLADVVGEAGDRLLDTDREPDLSHSLDFYTRKDPEQLLPVLRFFGSYLMQQARQAKDLRRQLFLVFKAVDLMRMIVQYSPYAVNYDAETLVSGIFSDLASQLPQRFTRYNEMETRIHFLMRRLHHASNDPQARALLADAYARQTSLYDALVQYQMLLKQLPTMRLELDRRRGLVYVRMGDIFQGLADMRPGALQDARKLRNFIERYNRDHPGRGEQIPRILGPDPAGLRRVQRSFRTLANRAYLLAVKVRELEPHVLLGSYTHLGANLVAEGRYKEAATALTEGNRFYKPAQETAPVLEQRLNYLDLLAEAANRSRRRDLFLSVQVQITEVKKRYRALSTAIADRERKRAALLENG
jgi:tetratricopeptide (TPR) repeat protein